MIPLPSLLTSQHIQLQERVKLILDLRERYERRLNRDFNSDANDDRGDLFSRWRIGIETQPKSGPKMTLIYQYAHDMAQTRAKNFSTENSDMKVAQLEGAVTDGWKYTFGRQKLNVGSERLIGSPEWGNVSRSYDGLRLSKGPWDVFGAAVAVNSPRLHDARVAGVTRKIGTSNNSLFYKHDNVGSQTVDIFTLDRSDSGMWSGLDWQLEGAFQFGRNLANDHRAWALHGNLGKKLDAANNVFLNADYASGSNGNGKSETFDSLYPTQHGKWGSMDLVGWRNIVLLSGGAEHAFTSDTKLKIQYWRFWLANSHDGWYSAGGGLNKAGKTSLIDPTGGSGRDLGSEIDVEVNTKTGPVLWGLGIATFSPGSFVENLTGKRDKQNWGYLQATYKF